MAVLVYLSIYAAVLIFLAGCVYRIRQYSSAPVHLRWELYPVPHESPSRTAHGGSYFEEYEWWKRSRHFHATGEISATASESFRFKGLWDHNRALWLCSFPFHAGLYLSFLAFVSSVAAVALRGWTTAALFLGVVAKITAWCGLPLVCLGAFALFIARLRLPRYRDYTAPADLATLVVFAVSSALLFFGRLFASGPQLSSFVHGLVHFDATLRLPIALSLGLLLGALMIAYIPYSQMGHFIAKYFTYHKVRWDDATTHDHPRLRASLVECLGYRPTWSAPHIGADGRKTWAEIATSIPEVRK